MWYRVECPGCENWTFLPRTPRMPELMLCPICEKRLPVRGLEKDGKEYTRR